MIASYPSRHFQIWEYKVSHGSLLVRSPRKIPSSKNIDIVFAGVEFIGLPRHLRGVEFDKGSADDIRSVKHFAGYDILPEQVFILISNGKRFPVVAAGFCVDENEADIFDSPFVPHDFKL